jgi:predicted HTH domain antitoxin
MPLIISDETLRLAGLTEGEMKIEIACRLFDAGKLHLWPAAQLAGLTRDEFLAELLARGIAAFRPTVDDLRQDLRAIEQLRGEGLK